LIHFRASCACASVNCMAITVGTRTASGKPGNA
jgi:hypothetical protein